MMKTKVIAGAKVRRADALVRQRAGVAVRVSLARAQQLNNNALTPSQYVREPELRINVLGGIGATTLRRLIEHNGFPPPRRLSERILAWERAAVLCWVESRETAPPGVNPGVKAARPRKPPAAPATLAAEGAAVRVAKGGLK